MITERIIEAVAKSGMKRTVIAAQIGVSDQTFCAMMQGKRKITAEEFMKICNVLNMTPNELCGYSSNVTAAAAL